MAAVTGWLIIVFGVAAASYAICAAVWLSIWPGETNEDHPKRLIFKDDR